MSTGPTPAIMPSGAFILAARDSPMKGEVQGARLLDIMPTLMRLAGYKIPEAMKGQSLVQLIARGVAVPTVPILSSEYYPRSKRRTISECPSGISTGGFAISF